MTDLLEAMEALKLDRGLVLTWDQEQTVRKDDREIAVVPVWKWLLGAV